MKRGEIWWVDHPAAGRRPACILSREEAIPYLRRVLLAPATTRVRAIPSELALGPDDGLPQECALSFDNIEAVSKSLLTERITALSSAQLEELCRRIRFATGC